MPEDMPEDMPDRMPEDMSEYMPEDMPVRMPDRMPEDMSDRMPQDLSVRKCINVMVGITRSKVIFSTNWRFAGSRPEAWQALGRLLDRLHLSPLGSASRGSKGRGRLGTWEMAGKEVWDSGIHNPFGDMRKIHPSI